ncbi:MAG: DUF423 domain-containing protein [Flavobacterium sp.]|nr:DUF423 domain-containing protein [Flavobacterium sp.]
MNRKLLLAASIFGILSIVLGAFGAHGLKAVLSPEQLLTFETGVKYQMYHALFLLFLASNSIVSDQAKKVILYLVIVGICFFSGSIYVLATNDISGFDFSFVGPITPIGGLLLILAWGKLVLHVFNQKA